MPLQKRLQFLTICLFLSVLAMAQKHSDAIQINAIDTTRNNYFSPNQLAITDSIINYGKLFLNTKYQFGASGVNSFDCSGFTSFVYHNFGYNLKRSSSEQAKQVSWVDRLKLKIGDLVFFSGRRKSKRVGHVGIVVSAKEDGKFNFIHASVQNGVIISSSDEPYYLKRFIHAGRVITDNQMMAAVPDFSKPQSNLSSSSAEIISAPLLSPSTSIQKIIPAKYHRVKKGETLSSIALKYGLTIAELKQKNNIKNSKINPKQRLKVKDVETILIVDAVKPPFINNQELASNQPISPSDISNKNEIPIENQQQTSHIVKKGESLFSISNFYHISVEELKKINNLISTKIHKGQKVKLVQNIEATSSPKPIVDNSGIESKANQNVKSESKIKPLIYKVQKGDNLLSISKENNISLGELKRINNLTNNKIRFGQELTLTQTTESKGISKKENIDKIDKTAKIIHHKVKSGESYYSIADDYNCGVNELREWNNKTGSKLKIGEKLVIYKKTN